MFFQEITKNVKKHHKKHIKKQKIYVFFSGGESSNPEKTILKFLR